MICNAFVFLLGDQFGSLVTFSTQGVFSSLTHKLMCLSSNLHQPFRVTQVFNWQSFFPMLFYLLDSRRLQILHILVCQSNTLQVRTLVLKGEIISYFCCYKIIVISILSSLRENNVSYSLVDIDQLCLSKTFDPFLTNEEGPFLSRCSRFFHPPQVRKFPA